MSLNIASRLWAPIAAAVFCLLLPCIAARAADSQAQQSAEVKLQTLDASGIAKLVAAKHGKIVVVDYWSTACPPCIREFPELIKLQERIGADRLAGVSVSLDYDGSDKIEEITPPVQKFLNKQRADKVDNVLSTDESDTALKKAGIVSIPAVLVYDTSGKLVERVTDPKAAGGKGIYARVNELVDDLLKK